MWSDRQRSRFELRPLGEILFRQDWGRFRSAIPGLCEQCGYLFAVELGLLFSGNVGASWDALRTYMKYV